MVNMNRHWTFFTCFSLQESSPTSINTARKNDFFYKGKLMSIFHICKNDFLINYSS